MDQGRRLESGPLDRIVPTSDGGFRAFLYGVCRNVAREVEQRSVRRGGDESGLSMAEVPGGASLPGTMLARREGEEHYVRFSTDGNIVTARFEDDAPFEPLLVVREDGSLVTIGALANKPSSTGAE